MAIHSNLKGGSSKKLYEALQYSGLVTEDMTFAEMCAVLAAEYPEMYALYMSSANEGGFEIFQKSEQSNATLNLGTEMVLSQTNAGTSRVKIYSDLLDMSRYKTLRFDLTASAGSGNPYTWIALFIDKEKVETNAYEPKDLTSGNSIVTEILLPNNTTNRSCEITIDLSSINGKYYIGVFLSSNNLAGETTQASISNMHMK